MADFKVFHLILTTYREGGRIFLRKNKQGAYETNLLSSNIQARTIVPWFLPFSQKEILGISGIVFLFQRGSDE